MAESLGFYSAAQLGRWGQLRAAGSYTTPAAALRFYASRATAADRFDVFLSHSYLDADAILGIVVLLEDLGLSVYVDWIVDSQLDRTKVSSDTADMLRGRMRQSKSFIYATSTSARSSIWMPWELGFFDGIGGSDRISIMPIEGERPGSEGQEYLDLYPAIEKVRDHGRVLTAAVEMRGRTFVSLKDFALGRL